MPPPDAPTPFSLADPDRVRSSSTAAGFATSSSNRSTSRWRSGPTPTRRSRSSSQVGIVAGLLHGVDDAGRAEGLDNLHAAFKEAETSEGVLLGTAAWLITATRT